MSRTPGSGLRLTREAAAPYSKRGGIAAANSRRWYVEGESLTSADVSERLGISLNAAQNRMRKLRLRGRALTWSALKLEKQQ